jgi:hypothetical protein
MNPSPTPPVARPLAPEPSRAGPGERISAAIIAAACLALLIVASRLTPDPALTGTHTQLGLQPCGLLVASGFPCPTCGMTTAFAAAAGARPLTALAAQPMGAVMALGTAVLFWGAVHVAVLGSNLGRIGARLLRPSVVWAAAGLGVLAWVYTIARIRGW